jgi:iron complex transport system permease protein
MSLEVAPPATEPQPDAAPAARSRPGRRVAVVTLVLGVGTVVLAILAAGTGAFHVPGVEVMGSLLSRLGIDLLPTPDELGTSVLWEVRFPRVVLAGLVGAALAAGGAIMQAIFANPLAEPGIVGVSAGAAVGAASAIVLGFTLLGPSSTAALAFVAALITTLAVYLGARRDGRTEVVTLVLTGIAVNAIAGAALGLLLFLSDDAALRSITFWNLGSVAGASWRSVVVVAVCLGVGLTVALTRARSLDLLALGERPAHHLGVDVERLRVTLIVVVALLAGAAVAVAGVITFVGLVVPHVIRLLIGPANRAALALSALGGAGLLIGADLLARTIAAPAEIPLGVLTALAGGPFFLWLLRRTRSRQGGWA